MAIENTYLLGKNITLGCGFDLQAKAPLDSRQTVPAFAGLQALINYDAAYEGMIVYDEETKKTYQAQKCDSYTVEVDGKTKTYDIEFREFGINESELKDLIASETTAAMEFKGAATALPENAAKGDMYKVTAAFKVGDEDVKIGDSIVYDGEQWFVIPSGDDIEDTWRPVTGVDNDSTLTFAAGDKLDVAVAADGTVTYSHEAIDAPANMNEEGDEQTRTYITQLITDNHGHVIGFKAATENVEDTNTTYEFEGQSDEATSVYFQVKANDADAAEVIYLDAYSKNEADAELAKKVDKAEGYSLVSDTEIARLAEVDNYDDEEVRGLIGDNAQAIDDLEAYVGTIPNVPDADGNNKYADLDVIGYINKKSQETLAAAQGGSSETAASVKGQLDDYIGENNTRVKAIEDDVAAIKDTDNGILKQAKDYADGLASNYDEAGAAAGVKSELETEIAKKVDKVDGKSLVDDAEITKLAGVSAGANKVEASENGKIKIDGVDTVVYTHPEKHTISEVDGLQDALDGMQAAGDYAAEVHTHVKADITDFAHTHTVSEITDFDDSVKAYDYATKSEAQGYADAKDESIAAAKKAGDDAQDAIDSYIESNNAALAGVKATADAAAVKADVDTALDGKVDKVDGYSLISDVEIARLAEVDNYDDAEVRGLIGDNADAIAAETERAEGIEAGLRTDVDAIKADYLKASDKEALQTQINTIMNNPDAEGAINSINEFTQYVKDHGTIADGFRADIDKNKEDIAANAKAIADHEVLATETYETKDDAAARLEEAKEYADTAAYAVIGTAADASSANTVFGAKKYADEKAAAAEAADAELAAAIESAKTEASNQDAVVLSESQKYTDDAKADAIAAAEGKVNALAGTVYTQDEVDAAINAALIEALQWSEF